MRLIRTEEARPGQKIARDVVDLRGSTLFGAGAAVTPELLETCRRRNVSHVYIDDGGDGASPADSDPSQEQLEREIDRQFARVVDQPLMSALKDAVRRHHRSRFK